MLRSLYKISKNNFPILVPSEGVTSDSAVTSNGQYNRS